MSLLGSRQTSRWFPLPSFKRNPPHRPCRAHLDWPVCFFLCILVSELARSLAFFSEIYLITFCQSHFVCWAAHLDVARNRRRVYVGRVCVILCVRARDRAWRSETFISIISADSFSVCLPASVNAILSLLFRGPTKWLCKIILQRLETPLDILGL